MHFLRRLLAGPIPIIFLTLMIPALANASAARPHVLLKTSKGDIELVLYPKKAPKTVKNFLEYVDNGFYSGTIFHRVIPNFVIQGGGYTQDFKQKKTRPPIPLEADNGLDNKRGTIAMARTSDPDSATAQFFINLRDNKNLNHGVYGPGYTVFGKVVKGMSVVDDIAGLSTGAAGPFAQDVPKQAVVIEKAKRLDQGH